MPNSSPETVSLHLTQHELDIFLELIKDTPGYRDGTEAMITLEAKIEEGLDAFDHEGKTDA